MINANRPIGFDPTIGLSQPIQKAQAPTATHGTPETRDPSASGEVQPHDESSAHAERAVVFSIAAAGFQELPEATAEDTSHFVITRQHEPIKSLSMVGTHVLVASGEHLIKMKLSDVEAALASGKLKADSGLARALVVHEGAISAGLSAGATRAVMKSYISAMADGQSPREAQLTALTNISTALQVEAYVANKDGLATDVRRVAEFTRDAFDSKAAGSNIAAIRNRTLKAEVIKQHQGWLDNHLHAFTDAFAHARETGDYAQAFDKLQSFFAVSVEITDTDYWKNRPETVIAALQSPPASRPQSVAPTHFAELLHVQKAQVPPTKQLQIPIRTSPAAEGGFFSNLKARVLDFFQTPPDTAGTGIVAETAARRMTARLRGQDEIACTGKLYRSPPPLQMDEPERRAPQPKTLPPPLTAKTPLQPGAVPGELAEDDEGPMPISVGPLPQPDPEPGPLPPQPPALYAEASEEPRPLGVARKRAQADLEDLGRIERTVTDQLRRLKPGDTLKLSTEKALTVGVQLNAVDFIPIAGDALKDYVALKVGAKGGVGTERNLEITVDPQGQVAIRMTDDLRVGAGVDAGVDVAALGIHGAAEANVRKGVRATIDMTFHSVADAAKWLAHPIDHGNVRQGTSPTPGVFVAKAREQGFLETNVKTELSGFVASSEKSSAVGPDGLVSRVKAALPGYRTTVASDTSRSYATPHKGEATVEDLAYSVLHYAGVGVASPTTSEVTVSATKRVAADGQTAYEKPTVALGLNLQKLLNLTKYGANGDAAREVIVDKMTESLKEAFETGNSKGFGGEIDTTDIRTWVGNAVRLLQDGADAVFGGEGVKAQSRKSLLGLTLLQGDMAKLSFDLERGANGKLKLGGPRISVEETTKLSLKVSVERYATFSAEAGVGASHNRQVATTGIPEPVVARHAPALGTGTRIEGDDGHLFYAVKTTADGATTLQDPVVQFRLDGGDLRKLISGKLSATEREAAIDAVMTSLVKDIGSKAQTAGLDGPIDPDRSKEAFKQALQVLSHHYQELKASDTFLPSKANYTVAYDDFASHTVSKPIMPVKQDMLLDFRLVKDASGAYALKSPLDSDTNASRLQQLESQVRLDLDVNAKGVGFLQARVSREGDVVPVLGLHAKVDEAFHTFDRVSDPDLGIRMWADKMLTQVEAQVIEPARNKGRFTGQFDRDQMLTSLMTVGKSLRDMRAQLGQLTATTKLVVEGEHVRVDVRPREGLLSGGHKLTIEFQPRQRAEDPAKWALPSGAVAAKDAVIGPSAPVVGKDLDVSVDHVGYLKVGKDDDDERVPVIGLLDKVDDMYKTFDVPPAPGSVDTEVGIRQWADKMLGHLQTSLLATASSKGTFTGTFDPEQMRASLIDVGRSLLAHKGDIQALRPGAQQSFSGRDLEVRIVPRNGSPGHKLVVEFKGNPATANRTEWGLPDGTLTTKGPVIPPREPAITTGLDVTVKHVGYFKADVNNEGELSAVMGLQDKVDTLFATLDIPPRPGSADHEPGVRRWADKMLTTVKQSFLAPAKSKGTFRGALDDAQMHQSLMALARSLHARRAEITALPQKSSLTLQGPGVEVRLVPRDSGTGHKLTVHFQPIQEAMDPYQWRLPEGGLT